jgi:hypothetical protein
MLTKRLLGIIAVAGLLVAACSPLQQAVSGAQAGKPTTMIGTDAAAPPAPPPTDQASRFSAQKAIPTSGTTAPASSEAGGAPGAGGASEQSDRMVVYNSTVALEVDSVGDSVNAVRSLTSSVGGIVAGASSQFKGDTEYATLTLRVPSDQYNRVMSELRGMAVRVTSENGSAKDVTDEFTDLGAQLRNYESTEAQLLELMKRANTIDEILKVQAQLTQVRGNIERTRGRINLLQKTSDMATIAVNLAPVGAPSQPGPRPLVWDPARSVKEAWEGSLRIVQGAADAGLRVLVFSWWLVPPALLAWAVWSARRRPAASPA